MRGSRAVAPAPMCTFPQGILVRLCVVVYLQPPTNLHHRRASASARRFG